MDPLIPLSKIIGVAADKMAGKKVDDKKIEVSKQQVTSQREKLEVNFTAFSIDELKNSIIEQLKRVNKNDPTYTKKASKIFVERVLVWQFGEHMLNDPDFMDLIAEVSYILEDEDILGTFINRV